jgi:gamma-glutamyltranspeptidase/glutathione hydrolase
VRLAPYSTRYAAEAIVCTVDNLAAQAGVEILRSGGSAVDAAIAAGAVLAVTQQHQCGLGGDLLALVHCPGDESPSALYAGGRAGSGADPQRLRAAGYEHMPADRDRACAPVPGCVDGWLALHERFGRLPLEVLLAPARSHASSGFSASQAVADAARLLAGVAHADDFIAGGPLAAGQIVRRPGVARALEAIAREGRRGFYEGEFGEALLESGNGEYTAADLVRVQADWVAPLGIDAFGQRLWSLPPSSQGYLLLRSAAIASGLQLPEPEHPDWAHLLIESSREAAADRDATWHEASDGQALIAPEGIAAMRARITSRAGVGRPAAVPGGTVSLCVVDRDRMAVSMLQSNFASWGSLRFVAGVGVALHNRGSCFSLTPGHPAAYGPGRRPPHTLAPALLTDSEGSLEATLATRGGHIQPQILLQLLARLYAGSETPAHAMAAGRWAHSPEGVLLEGQAPASWFDGLSTRGHGVQRRPPFQDEFGHAQLIVSAGDHLAAASDPRSPTWAVGAL